MVTTCVQFFESLIRQPNFEMPEAPSDERPRVIDERRQKSLSSLLLVVSVLPTQPTSSAISDKVSTPMGDCPIVAPPRTRPPLPTPKLIVGSL